MDQQFVQILHLPLLNESLGSSSRPTRNGIKYVLRGLLLIWWNGMVNTPFSGALSFFESYMEMFNP